MYKKTNFRYQRHRIFDFKTPIMLCLAFIMGFVVHASDAQAITAGTYEIKAAHSGKCLDVYRESKDNGEKVLQWQCHGGDNQQWKVTPVSGGYQLIAKSSGKCLDVTKYSTNNGANLQQWTCSSGKNKSFAIDSKGDGQYSIRALHSSKCVDVAKRSGSNGATIQQWSCHTGSNQRFIFKAVGDKPNTPSTPSTPNTPSTPTAKSVWSENFEKSSVGERWFGKNYTEIRNGCGVNGSRCVRVTYNPSSEGSPRIGANKSLPAAREYTLNYDVMFEDGWQFVKGGKLPGLGPTKVITGCAANQKDGWSARVMWRRNGTPVIYSYHQDRANRCGDDFYSSSQFDIGKYQAISLHVKVNDPGIANGVINLYLDGRKIASHQNVQLRDAGGSKTEITNFLFSTFFGGSDESWAPSKTVYARFDNFAVYPGLRVRGKPGQ